MKKGVRVVRKSEDTGLTPIPTPAVANNEEVDSMNSLSTSNSLTEFPESSEAFLPQADTDNNPKMTDTDFNQIGQPEKDEMSAETGNPNQGSNQVDGNLKNSHLLSQQILEDSAERCSFENTLMLLTTSIKALSDLSNTDNAQRRARGGLERDERIERESKEDRRRADRDAQDRIDRRDR